MHTIMIISGGLVLLIAFLVGGRVLGATAKGALLFVPVWLVGAAINMWVGINHAGYTFVAELPIFMIVFGLPAALALLVRHYSR